eukprot:3149154-Pleurochrysis_carterae.AAC.1
MVSVRSPTPALSDDLTSSRVDRLSLRRRTALATFSESTESGNCAAVGSERLSRCIEWTNALKAVTVGSLIPLTSCECIIAAMVSLVAVEAAFASFARMRNSSLPLPLQASVYVRRAAWHVTVCKIMGGKPETDPDGVVDTGAAAAGAAEASDCERVWRVVDCRFEGAIVPCMVNTGLRGDGESKV